MAILVDSSTRVIVCGMTGREGSFHTEQMLAYGTKVVGGVTPGKGGTEHLGVPVFDTVKQAVASTQANAALIFVPAPLCTGLGAGVRGRRDPVRHAHHRGSGGSGFPSHGEPA